STARDNGQGGRPRSDRDPPDARGTEREASMRERDGGIRPRGRIRRWWPLLPLAAFAWVVWTASTLRAFAIPSASLSPAVAPGDRVVAGIPPLSSPRRGELWVFRLPPGTNLAVKRVIGLPGETIRVASGRVLVDGRPLAEPYVAVPPSYAVPPTKLKP